MRFIFLLLLCLAAPAFAQGPRATAEDTTCTEGQTCLVEITSTERVRFPLTVDLQLVGGITQPSDITGWTSVTFQKNDSAGTVRTIEIFIADDDIAERDETAEFELSSGLDRFWLTILDND